MSHTANDRYRIRGAPDGLALVQDLLNTRPIQPYGDDLLADRADAEAWATQAVAQWSTDTDTDTDGPAPPIALPPAELRSLRALRTTFEELVRTGHPQPDDVTRHVPATLVAGPTGEVRLTPAGRGARWLVSALWIEVFRAQQAGSWSRLKLCRNSGCSSAFYDTSRNNSGVWHDVRTCGNVANLRASRQRKRDEAAARLLPEGALRISRNGIPPR